jgi:hypothetical protein
MLRISWCLEAMLKNQHHPKALDIPRLPNTRLCGLHAFDSHVYKLPKLPQPCRSLIPSVLSKHFGSQGNKFRSFVGNNRRRGVGCAMGSTASKMWAYSTRSNTWE